MKTNAVALMLAAMTFPLAACGDAAEEPAETVAPMEEPMVTEPPMDTMGTETPATGAMGETPVPDAMGETTTPDAMEVPADGTTEAPVEEGM